jgi:hypothetical protein
MSRDRTSGEHRLRDLSQPQRLYQLRAEGLEETFPVVMTLDLTPGNLPIQATSFLGRQKEGVSATHKKNRAGWRRSRRFLSFARIRWIGPRARSSVAVSQRAEFGALQPMAAGFAAELDLAGTPGVGTSHSCSIPDVTRVGRVLERRHSNRRSCAITVLTAHKACPRSANSRRPRELKAVIAKLRNGRSC